MILVFAGAGASYAVNTEQYPTTRVFFERLPSTIVDNPIFPFCVQFLQAKKADAQIDVEELLWVLEELENYASQGASAAAFPGWLFEAGHFGSLGGAHGIDGAFRGASSKVAESTARLRSDIHQLVYELYGDDPSHERLEATWLPFLRVLGGKDSRLEVLTTNYDVVLEEAFAVLNQESSGGERFSTGVVGKPHNAKLNLDYWRNFSPESKPRSLLTKLHGSANWTYDKNGRICVGPATFHGNHKKHAIIYPGLGKGDDLPEPFALFHEYLRQCVTSADTIIVIGFAFRDRRINAILSEAKPHSQKLILDPNPPGPGLPWKKKDYNHACQGFDRGGQVALLARMSEAAPQKVKAVQNALSSQEARDSS